MTALLLRKGGGMEKWLEAAFDYARAKDMVGWLLLSGAAGYLFWKVTAKVGTVIGATARFVLARYDKIISDWEEVNRRKNEEIQAKDEEIAMLRDELRQARAEAAAALHDSVRQKDSRRGRDRTR